MHYYQSGIRPRYCPEDKRSVCVWLQAGGGRGRGRPRGPSALLSVLLGGSLRLHSQQVQGPLVANLHSNGHSGVRLNRWW